MKQRTVHTLFAAASGACALLLMNQWFDWQRAEASNEAIASARSADADTIEPVDALPVRLARANVYAANGDLDTAERLFSALVSDTPESQTGKAAAYNLANAYLREALREELDNARKLPLAELAKQRYRDLLRADPVQWDVRYNLERALLLAPEQGAEIEEDGADPVKRVQVIVPDFEIGDLP